MEQSIIEMFCDGSCKASDPERAGAYCASIRLPGGELETVCGSKNKTTISLMEIEAVCCGLSHLILNVHDPKFFPEGIEGIKIYTDSEYVVKCATGENQVKANKHSWAIFKLLIRNLINSFDQKCLNVEIGHIPRNSVEEAAQADFVVDQLRRSMEQNMSDMKKMEDFHKGKLKR